MSVRVSIWGIKVDELLKSIEEPLSGLGFGSEGREGGVDGAVGEMTTTTMTSPESRPHSSQSPESPYLVNRHHHHQYADFKFDFELAFDFNY